MKNVHQLFEIHMTIGAIMHRIRVFNKKNERMTYVPNECLGV